MDKPTDPRHSANLKQATIAEPFIINSQKTKEKKILKAAREEHTHYIQGVTDKK